MSSILEALKKLEAEKSAQSPYVSTSTSDPAYGGGALSDDYSDRPMKASPPPALLWVLGGGIFTLLIVGVAVLVVMLLLRQESTNGPVMATRTPTPAIAASEPAVSAENTLPATPPMDEATETASTSDNAATDVPPEKTTTTLPVIDPVRPASRQAPVSTEPAPKFPEETMVTTPVAPRALSTSAPSPPKQAKQQALPPDIRNLPMMTRSERSQYRLEGIKLNMLNPAGPTRPLGNAFINLEKVFIGEFLPGSNAKLLEVTNHGVAIELQSTQQRYYIPR